jgi:hypothetical protein
VLALSPVFSVVLHVLRLCRFVVLAVARVLFRVHLQSLDCFSFVLRPRVLGRGPSASFGRLRLDASLRGCRRVISLGSLSSALVLEAVLFLFARRLGGFLRGFSSRPRFGGVVLAFAVLSRFAPAARRRLGVGRALFAARLRLRAFAGWLWCARCNSARGLWVSRSWCFRGVGLCGPSTRWLEFRG